MSFNSTKFRPLILFFISLFVLIFIVFNEGNINHLPLFLLTSIITFFFLGFMFHRPKYSIWIALSYPIAYFLDRQFIYESEWGYLWLTLIFVTGITTFLLSRK